MAAVIAKPDTHRREYSFLELDNGLRAIVASDPLCDKAGAGLCVNVGMCHERKDLPGLAHFLEHMLFTGTAKYPKEGEYHEFIQQNGGGANAYTTCYFTNYMFDVKPEVLPQALDRFAGFFVEPLLTKDCTDREINAVDSEFQGGHTQPWWRYVGIMNMSANPEHPFHVAVGNNKVLKDEPKERGIDLYEEMTKLYHSCYSANGMTLCLIGRESTEELQTLVKDKFGGVVNKNVTMPIGDSVSDKPAFLPQDWNRLLLQAPVKDVKILTFGWVLPYQAPLWKTKPTAYPMHLLGYEGEGSVISVLKQKGLISGCSSGDGGWLEGAFSLLKVNFDLTDAGLNAVEEIGAHLFAFIGMLQKAPVEQWIFDEMRKLRQIQFKFSEDVQPFDLCPDVALSLQTYPPEEVLAGGSLLYEYDSAAISATLSRLTLDSVRVSHQAKSLAERCTDKDTSYDSPMKFLPLEPQWLNRWTAALGPVDRSAEEAVAAAAALGLALPKPNPFIPEDLALKELPADPPLLPMRVDATVPGVPRIFHRQDDVFKQPKAHIAFCISSPFITESVESFTKAELWCRSICEALSEYAYDAEVAGVSYSLGIQAGAISLQVMGFNDKLGVLLDAVTSKIWDLAEVPENIYSIVTDAYSDEIKNAAFHSPPYAQCSMRFNELISRGSGFPAYQRYEAFKTITRECLAGFAEKLFKECHIEAAALGNATAEDATSLAVALARGLRVEKPLTVLPKREEAVLLPGSTVWDLNSTDADDPNHAVFLRMQLPDSLETDMHMRLVDKVLAPKFFDILRTQQQLGYIVQMAASPSTKFCYLIAVVQTEFPPDYARGRIDAFLEDQFAFIATDLSEEEFQTCREGLLSDLRMKPKNLFEEMSRYWKLVVDRTYDFERRNRAIAFVESSVTLSSFRAFVGEQLRGAPRIYNQVRKIIAKEDKALPDGCALPSDPASLRRWTTHSETVAAFAAEASWLTFDVNP